MITSILIGFSLWIPVAMVFYAGYKLGQRHKHVDIGEISKEEAKRQKDIDDHYNNLMNYDASVAYKRRVK